METVLASTQVKLLFCAGLRVQVHAQDWGEEVLVSGATGSEFRMGPASMLAHRTGSRLL